MITSYVTPERNLLYLSVVGPLNSLSADDLVTEYCDRHAAGITQCILDLAEADAVDQPGLNALQRLSLLAQVDGVEFAVVARGSQAEPAIADAALALWIPLVDASTLPFRLAS